MSRVIVGDPASRSRRLWAGLAVLAATGLSLTATAPAADAASITAVSFSGGAGTYVAPDGALYATTGAEVRLTVETDDRTKCVAVSGAHTEQQTGSGPFTFSFAAGAPGLQALTIKAGNGNNANSCNGSVDTAAASYTVDNTGPTLTATLDPAQNAAGWNNSDVTVTWSATDDGAGVADGPTPGTETVSTNGTFSKTATATDRLGNVGTGWVVVRLDKNAPSIVGQRSPAPNAAGWNNTDVTVTWTCADSGGSGIKGSCPPPATLTDNGADQSVSSGPVSDVAGNTSSATVDAINIDKVAPTLSGTATTAPNENGWYRDDVVIDWTATDAHSGVTAPDPTTITGEGTGLTAAASVEDRAGNHTEATSEPVSIDRTAPVTTVQQPTSWSREDVALSLTAQDGLSGVDTTYYRLDGAATKQGTEVTVSEEGSHELAFWSVDAAGNVEPTRTVSFGIDRTAPAISHSLDPAPVDGWNNGPVTVTFECNDDVSGIASCTEPYTVDRDGIFMEVIGEAVDNAGNSATDTALVSIDTVKPTIVASVPEANEYGWYGEPVTVGFACSDALSGIGSCSDAHTFGEGENQSVTGTAVDVARNRAEVQVDDIDVDLTAPSLTGHVVGTPNADGWFSDDVVVSWECADSLSGVVECPGDTVVDGEGEGLSVTESVTDRAGHTTVATVEGIDIDRHAPVTTADAPDDWQNAPVTVRLSASDNLSGVAETRHRVDDGEWTTGDHVTISTEGVHTVSFSSVDKAGNVEDASSVEVSLDLSAPTVTADQEPAPNEYGWNNTDVTVSFLCADVPALSGLATCSEPTTLTDEGAGQEVVGTASDNAGNEATASAVVNIDKSAPTISGAVDRAPDHNGWYTSPVTVSFECTDQADLSGVASCEGDREVSDQGDNTVTGSVVDRAGNLATTEVSGIRVDSVAPSIEVRGVVDGGEYVLGDVPTPACTATDATSGLDGDCTGTATGGESNGVGSFAYTATASDLAGNTATTTVHYTVRYGYGERLFLQPVNDTVRNPELARSVFKAGQTVPVKFRLTDASGNPVVTATAPRWVTPTQGAATSGAPNEGVFDEAADSGSTYRLSGDQYIYNWKTDGSQAGYYWRIGVRLDDGHTYYVWVGLR